MPSLSGFFISNRARVIAISAILMGVLALDLCTTRDSLAWVLCLLVMIAATRLVGNRSLKFLAAVASGLTVLGFIFSPPELTSWLAAISRFLSLVLLWAIVWMELNWRHRDERLRRLEKAVDGSNDIVFMTDPKGVITFINPAFTQTYGYTAEEVVGKTTPRILRGGEVAPEVYKTFWEMLNEKRQVRGEFVNKTKDGRLATMDSSASAILDARGEIVGFLGIQRDISERKRAEEAVNLFRSLIDHTSEGIEVIDPETGRFLDVNESACLDHGYTREEYLALTVAEIDPLVAARPWVETMEELRRVGSRMFESQHQRKDGSLFPVEINARYISLDRDYLLAVVRDITERVEAAKELKKTEAQFLQAQKMEAVGRLAGGVAHDFNNLLTIINGYSDLMLGTVPEGGRDRDYLEEVRQAGQRAAALTRQLLAFSRRQTAVLTFLDLNSIVEGLHKMLDRLIGEDIEFVAHLAKDIGQVKADPGQIEQVIMNLVVNARDAMPKGGKLMIETTNAELADDYTNSHLFVAPGRYVMLSVSDTGCGMDAETQSHIFEPFFTTKDESKGTGLGLSTVYGIIHQAGGHVNVYSEVGKGTTFRVYLPRIDHAAEPEPGQKEKGVSVSGTETVLLVEDEPSVRHLTQRVLKSHGYTVLVAGTPEEALSLARTHQDRIQLLLTDVIMPGMNGKELADRFALSRPETKVLFTSGYTADAVGQHGILEEGIAFLAKPYTPRELLRNVRRVLDINVD